MDNTIITDEELDFALEKNIEQVEKEIGIWASNQGVNPYLVKDPNGRYILLDAYTALANFRAATRR